MEKQQTKKKGVKGKGTKGKGRKTSKDKSNTEATVVPDTQPLQEGRQSSSVEHDRPQDVSLDMEGPSVAITLDTEEHPQVGSEGPSTTPPVVEAGSPMTIQASLTPDIRQTSPAQVTRQTSPAPGARQTSPTPGARLTTSLTKERQTTPGARQTTSLTKERQTTPVPGLSAHSPTAHLGPESSTSDTSEHIVTVDPTDTITNTQRVESESIDFSSVNAEDYGLVIEDDELPADFIYEPPPHKDLPDLYNLLASLEEGDGELVTKQPPPSLFTIPEHIPSYTKISELRHELEGDELQPYISRFDTKVKDDVVMLGKISLEEVQEEEQRLRDEHILYLEQEARLSRERQEKLLTREEEAKNRMAAFVKDKRSDIARREELLRQREKLMLDHIHKAFRRAESQLIGSLERRKGEVKTLYGDLMLSDGQYGGSKGRRWKVDWNRTPQPIKINLNCLRGVKDKMPGGRYVMMVSIYNRLGGHSMRWSKLKGQTWGGSTVPIVHEGYFYNTEIKVNQSMFTVLPAKASLRPGMVLVFELFLLRGSILPTDRVVAWGCFPISDANFDVIEGKYKCPLLRGEMNPEIDKHEKIEELISSDIDHWVANLYFEMVKLPRYLAGQNEYEVELQFSSKLTNYPDRVMWDDTNDGQAPVSGSNSDINSSNGSIISDSPIASTSGDTITTTKSLFKKNIINTDTIQQSSLSSNSTNIGSRVIQKDLMIKNDEEGEDESAIRREADITPHKTMPGVYYKRYLTNPADEYFKQMYSMIPQTSVLTPRHKKKALTHIEQLEEHSFSVKAPFSGKGRFAKSGREKMNYIARQFLAEIGLSQWRSKEFWGMMFLFFVIFFIRMFAHYFGQWLFLNAIGIPINKFDFLPYTVDLNYQPTLLRTREEIGVVVLGPMMNILIFVLLVIFAWLCPKLFGLLPDLFSKFILSFGLLTFLNPLLILIVDCCLLRFNDQSISPIADFAKLWWHFNRSQGSGLAGVFITLFLYMFVALLSAAILYMYFLRLHNNGRMLDIFWRLHGDEEKFFVPYDLEMSNQELSYICRKAEKWRGEEGERRKVAVYDYIWEEEEVEESIWNEEGIESIHKREGRKEITTHISIHTIHLDGLRELYRHFLKLPDGAIVEVFGDVSIPGMDKDVKSALEQGAKNLENLMGSQVSLSKVKGRQTVMTRAGFTPGYVSPSPSVSSAVPSNQSSEAPELEKKKLL